MAEHAETIVEPTTGVAPIQQYSLRKILLVWAVAAIPMGILGWLVAPALAQATQTPAIIRQAVRREQEQRSSPSCSARKDATCLRTHSFRAFVMRKEIDDGCLHSNAATCDLLIAILFHAASNAA